MGVSRERQVHINLSELELDFNDILRIAFLEENTRTLGGPCIWLFGVTEGKLIPGVCLLHILTAGRKFQPKPLPPFFSSQEKNPGEGFEASSSGDGGIQEYKLPH